MLFSLYNALSTFQTFINKTLYNYLNIIYIAYLNNVLIYLDNKNKYKNYILIVLRKISKVDIYLNTAKCTFSTKRVRYLSFILTTNGLEIDLKKVATILEQQTLRNVKNVQVFLRFANFYKQFIKGFLLIAKHLIELTKVDGKKAFSLTLDLKALAFFQRLKNTFKTISILIYFNANLDTQLEINALDFVIATMLLQIYKGVLRSITFIFYKINLAKYNYKIYNKKLLTIIQAFKKQRFKLARILNLVKVLSNY